MSRSKLKLKTVAGHRSIKDDQEFLNEFNKQDEVDLYDFVFHDIGSPQNVDAQELEVKGESDDYSEGTQETPDEIIELEATDSQLAYDCRKNEWLIAPTKLLISLVKELKPKIGRSVELKTKKRMWCVIADKLCAQGYLYNSLQVETKYYSLIRSYQNSKRYNSQEGRLRQSFPFEEDILDLLTEKKKRNMVNPPNEPTVEKVNDTKQGAQQFEIEILKYLKRKEERALRSEERAKKKLILLEEIVEILSNT